MRLIRLRIKNIASLKGEHVVDFESIQAQSSLFAITGETGAGKSTILTSIGTALYGQNHKKLEYADLVTLGEREGEIELVFQAKDRYYLAQWWARVRGQNGELLKKIVSHQHLFPLEGKEFNSIRGERLDSAEGLLNLTFDQFCKCIILNQGEFARFLSSSFTHRKEILEKLYPGELLDNLSRELKSQLDQLEREKSDLAIKLGELKSDPLSGDDLKAQKQKLKSDLDLHENWLKKVEGLEFHFISLFSSYTKFHENKKKADLIRQELSEATSRYNQFLKESQILGEAYVNIKAHEEKEMPKLRELLKVEEALKLAKESQSLTKKKIDTLTVEIKNTDLRLSEGEARIKSWNESHQKILTALDFDVNLLKSNQSRLEKVFDLFTGLNGHKKELKAMEEKLQELEIQGKDINTQFTSVSTRLTQFPIDLPDKITNAEQRKQELSKSFELRQKTEIKSQDLQKILIKDETQIAVLDTRLKEVSSELLAFEQEQIALENTIKLHELNSAVEFCLNHADSVKADTCPVCATSVLPVKWGEILSNLKKADITSFKKRSGELSRLIIQLQEVSKHSLREQQTLEESKKQNQVELALALNLLEKPHASPNEIEEEIKALSKQSWELESIKTEEIRLKNELSRARENYLKAKNRGQELLEIQKQFEDSIEAEANLSEGLIAFPLSLEMAESLKENLRRLTQFQNSESQGDKLIQERTFVEKSKATLEKDRNILMEELNLTQGRIQEFVSTLAPLGKGPQELIESLVREVKELTEKWTQSEKEAKQFELALKDFQSRLYTIDEQLREYDHLFAKEKHALRESAQLNLPTIKEELSLLIDRLKNLALDFNSPLELFIPLKDILASEKETLRNEGNTIRESLAGVQQRLLDWEKRQDKIQVLELTGAEIEGRLQRAKRLSDVLGKDELRSFVLSLVEENLIIQTNDELQKLCQGRYEIIHQSRGLRMTPEFYILDKFREGGRRKVSTLSGGETFMVSLAMALALAEMTRGQAEIDSLFIDEGFGTLDQDSLEDVLDMLNQIQTRGLLVGIISHIKTLTHSIPVNLLVEKKSDGTSSLDIRLN